MIGDIAGSAEDAADAVLGLPCPRAPNVAGALQVACRLRRRCWLLPEVRWLGHGRGKFRLASLPLSLSLSLSPSLSPSLPPSLSARNTALVEFGAFCDTPPFHTPRELKKVPLRARGSPHPHIFLTLATLPCVAVPHVLMVCWPHVLMVCWPRACPDGVSAVRALSS